MRGLGASSLSTALTALMATAGCDDLMVIEYGVDEGILPMTYEETIAGLPSSFTPAEWPDGTIVLQNAGGDVRLVVNTRPDGGRDVTIQREVALLSSYDAVWLRDLFGEEKINAIRGLDLAILDLDVAGVDFAICGIPDLTAAGVALPTEGARTAMGAELLETLRARLLAGEAIHVPISLTFHLGADELELLPPYRLHVAIAVQPTLFVDVIDAL